MFSISFFFVCVLTELLYVLLQLTSYYSSSIMIQDRKQCLIVGMRTYVWQTKSVSTSHKHALPKGPVTRCNFSCNLQRNSTLKRCKFVTNVWCVKNILANCDGNLCLPILHLPRVELHCKLQEKLYRVTGA